MAQKPPPLPPSPGRRLGPGPQAGHQRGEINRHWPALTIMAAARVMDRPAAARGLSFTYKLYVIRRRKKTNTGQTSVTDRLKKRHKLVLFGKRAVLPSGCIVECTQGRKWQINNNIRISESKEKAEVSTKPKLNNGLAAGHRRCDRSDAAKRKSMISECCFPE